MRWLWLYAGLFCSSVLGQDETTFSELPDGGAATSTHIFGADDATRTERVTFAGAVDASFLKDADWGDLSIAGGVASLDSGAVDDAVASGTISAAGTTTLSMLSGPGLYGAWTVSNGAGPYTHTIQLPAAPQNGWRARLKLSLGDGTNPTINVDGASTLAVIEGKDLADTATVDVYCEFAAVGGAWTLVRRADMPGATPNEGWIYCEEWGDDNNPGTKQLPVRTPARVQELMQPAYNMGKIGRVRFGPGLFLVEDPFFISTGTFLVGAGTYVGNAATTGVRYGTYLKLMDGANCDMIVQVPSNATTDFGHAMMIKDLVIDGNKANNSQGSGLILTDGGFNTVLENVFFRQCAGWGEQVFYAPVNLYHNNVTFGDNTAGAVLYHLHAGGENATLTSTGYWQTQIDNCGPAPYEIRLHSSSIPAQFVIDQAEIETITAGRHRANVNVVGMPIKEGLVDVDMTAANANADTNQILLTAHGLTTESKVMFYRGDVPKPLVIGVYYWVVTPNVNDFQLSLTKGGAAIDLADVGSYYKMDQMSPDRFELVEANVDEPNNQLTIASHGLVVNERFTVYPIAITAGTDVLPGGLTAGAEYFVESVVGVNTITIKDDLADVTPIEITNDGTGTFAVHLDGIGFTTAAVNIGTEEIALPVGHPFATNDQIWFDCDDPPLMNGINYSRHYAALFAINVDADSMQISASSGGSARDIQDVGSGDMSIGRYQLAQVHIDYRSVATTKGGDAALAQVVQSAGVRDHVLLTSIESSNAFSGLHRLFHNLVSGDILENRSGTIDPTHALASTYSPIILQPSFERRAWPMLMVKHGADTRSRLEIDGQGIFYGGNGTSAPVPALQLTTTNVVGSLPYSGSLSGGTGLPIVGGTTGTLTVARGGTGLTTPGTALQVLRMNAGATALEFATLAGSGDVVGPASAVDNRIVLFDGTTGKLVKDSGSLVSDFATAAQGALADSALQPTNNLADVTDPEAAFVVIGGFARPASAFVGATDLQTVADKRLRAMRYVIDDHGGAVVGPVETIDFDNGNVHIIRLDQNVTITFANWDNGFRTPILVRYIQTGAGGWTVSYAAGSNPVDPDPTIDTTANAITDVTYESDDGGTTIYGRSSVIAFDDLPAALITYIDDADAQLAADMADQDTAEEVGAITKSDGTSDPATPGDDSLPEMTLKRNNQGTIGSEANVNDDEVWMHMNGQWWRKLLLLDVDGSLVITTLNTGTLNATTFNSPTWTRATAGAMTIGDAGVSSLTVTTTGTGNGTVVLPNESIESLEILDGTVGAVDMADDAVSLAKMAAGTAGNLITYDAGGNPAAMATGTVGQVVTSNGAGAAPTMQALPGTTGVFRTIWIDAGAIVPRTTNGAAVATEEYVTNDIMSDHLLFDSGATVEGGQWRIAMPDEWNLGTIKAKIYWDAATGATAADTVEWRIRARAVSNDDPADGAWGTAVTVGDAVIAVGDVHVTAASASLTVGGTPALGDVCWFEIDRNGPGTDDMTEDAKLLGVMIQYQESTTEPVSW